MEGNAYILVGMMAVHCCHTIKSKAANFCEQYPLVETASKCFPLYFNDLLKNSKHLLPSIILFTMPLIATKWRNVYCPWCDKKKHTYFYYVDTNVLMYVEVVWLYCRSCMWTWKYSPHINLPTCTCPLLLLQVHRHSLLDQREQVWPASLCVRLLLRPPEGLHQQGGTGKVLHQQVGQGVVVVGARLCLCSRVFVIRHMSCMYVRHMYVCMWVYVCMNVCMYISM